MAAPIVKKVTSPALMPALLANRAEWLLALGRAAGAQERDDGKVRWAIGGAPIAYHNAVVTAQMAPGEVEELIRASLETMWEEGVAGAWHVGPDMQPDDVSYYLEANEFRLAGADVGLAVELRSFDAAPRLPAGLTVAPADDPASLAELARSLGQSSGYAQWRAEMLPRLVSGDDISWRHYLARMDESPVAALSLLFSAGVAGLYVEPTVLVADESSLIPLFCRHALQSAYAAGYRVAVTSVPENAATLTSSLGFRQHCRVNIYESTI
jgi:hypothetical protein